MSRHDDKVYLEHMLEAAEAIQRYVAGMDWESFRVDVKTQDAVIRRIEVIGEACSHVSQEFRAKHPILPWSDIIGMRNILIHEYFGVDVEEVWRTATQEVPDLLAKVRQLLHHPET